MTVGGVLVRLAVHMVLTGLPLLAAMLIAVRLRVRSVPITLVIGLAASGAGAMLIFWLFYVSPTVGKIAADLWLIVSACAIVWCVWRGGIERETGRALAVPLGLWVLGTTFLVFLGLLHGGAAEALSVSTARFSPSLPSDNTIPFFYAGWFFAHGHHGTPPVFPGGWQFSDRPPLQVGYVLSQEAIDWDAGGVTYELIGVALQQLWIIGLWALLLASGIERRTRALVMVGVLVSDLAIVNGFYVWPKLLPAAMLLGAAALILTPLYAQTMSHRLGPALIGALLGLAMMGHGTSIFGVIPLGVIALWRMRRRWARLVPALVAIVVVMAPWSAYQKYADPPGNRLTRWALSGNPEISGPGAVDAALTAYRQAGLDRTANYKLFNAATVEGMSQVVDTVPTAVGDLVHGRSPAGLVIFRELGFYLLLPSLGLLLLAPIAMAIGRLRGRVETVAWGFALRCGAVALVSTVLWCLILFGNEIDDTVIHQGSYLVPILWFCATITGLRAAFPRFAVGLVALNAGLMLALYIPDPTPIPGSSYSVLAAVLCAASLSCFIRLVLVTSADATDTNSSPAPAGWILSEA